VAAAKIFYLAGTGLYYQGLICARPKPLRPTSGTFSRII